MEKQEYIVLDYEELNKLVTSNYGVEFDFVAAQEANQALYSFNITEKTEIHEYDMKILRDWILGKRQPWPVTVLQDLVNKDVLQPGNYLIDARW